MSGLPQKFQPLLPSIEVGRLDAKRDKRYIIQSLLKNSTMEAWQWMMSEYSRQDVAEVVRTARGLHPKDVRVWTHYLNIPTEEVACLQPKSPNTLKTYWAY